MPKKPSAVSTEYKPNRIYIGIDPGQNGGLASMLVCETSIDVGSIPMPSSERDVWQWFRDFQFLWGKSQSVSMTACIEKVHSMPEQGVASSFKFGMGYGFLLGCLTAAGIPFETVTPQLWQKSLSIPPRKKTETQPQFKNRLREHAQRLYPSLEIWSEPRSKGRQLAISDALLICHYCKLQNQGN